MFYKWQCHARIKQQHKYICIKIMGIIFFFKCNFHSVFFFLVHIYIVTAFYVDVIRVYQRSSANG